MKFSAFLRLVCVVIVVSTATGFVIPDLDIVLPKPPKEGIEYECKVSFARGIILINIIIVCAMFSDFSGHNYDIYCWFPFTLLVNLRLVICILS